MKQPSNIRYLFFRNILRCNIRLELRRASLFDDEIMITCKERANAHAPVSYGTHGRADDLRVE